MTEQTEKTSTNDAQIQTNDDLLRGFSNDEIELEPATDTGAENITLIEHEENNAPRLQPGDHVIRWKMIKVMLWPIQIHGIVMGSEVNEDGSCSVVIADFGYSSTEDDKKKKGLRNIGNINGMMRNFYEGTGKKNSNDVPEPANTRDAEGEEDDDEIDKEDGKRFHLRTITDPQILKKWSKVNYGQSLFSPNGKFDKFKKLFKLPNKQKPDDKADNESSMFDENDEFFKSPEKSKDTKSMASATSAPSPNYSDDAMYNTLAADSGEFDKRTQQGGAMKDIKEMNPLEQLVSQANEVERRSRPRSRGFLRGGRSSNISDDSSVTSKRSLNFKPPSFKPPSMKGVNNIMKKLSFQKNTPEEYDTVPASASKEENEKRGEGPKLPKSDPRVIVVARVKFILAEQEKSESETSLPKYHILYSNSECLAVWCKTGRFSTLQAAVFLHSTAVGNAKSSIMLGAGIAATQPWLIPVVGVYAVAAVGMPYYILNKCKNKWKEGEMRLTHGFWETADVDVFIAAIQNWSGLCPEEEEDSDEVEVKETKPTPAKTQIVQV